jgi:hypothetical protein
MIRLPELAIEPEHPIVRAHLKCEEIFMGTDRKRMAQALEQIGVYWPQVILIIDGMVEIISTTQTTNTETAKDQVANALKETAADYWVFPINSQTRKLSTFVNALIEELTMRAFPDGPKEARQILKQNLVNNGIPADIKPLLEQWNHLNPADQLES